MICRCYSAVFSCQARGASRRFPGAICAETARLAARCSLERVETSIARLAARGCGRHIVPFRLLRRIGPPLLLHRAVSPVQAQGTTRRRKPTRLPFSACGAAAGCSLRGVIPLWTALTTRSRNICLRYILPLADRGKPTIRTFCTRWGGPRARISSWTSVASNVRCGRTVSFDGKEALRAAWTRRGIGLSGDP